MVRRVSNQEEPSLKSVLESPFTLPILEGIEAFARPSLIAKRLGVTQQRLRHHTLRCRAAGLIKKESIDDGLVWSLEEKGRCWLDKLRKRKSERENFPMRAGNVAFVATLESKPHLPWKDLKNGVQECTIPLKEHKAQFISSKTSTKLTIFVPEKYAENPLDAIVVMFQEAFEIIQRLKDRIGFMISGPIRLARKPEFSFEKDLLALHLSKFQLAAIEEEGKKRVWTDNSKGAGEIETNDPLFAYRYLRMADMVYQIYELLISRQNSTRNDISDQGPASPAVKSTTVGGCSPAPRTP
jgi:hypothetical protein